MKNFVLFTLIAVFLGGCAYRPARYDNIESARQGRPDHGTYSQQDYFQWELANLCKQQQQMAVDKLRGTTPEIEVSNGTPNGYLGIVKNFDESNTYNFIIKGNETISFLLSPGQQKEYHLVPGRYECVVYRDNRQIGDPWNFTVGLQKHYFMDRWVHWYVLMQR